MAKLLIAGVAGIATGAAAIWTYKALVDFATNWDDDEPWVWDD